MFVTWRVASSWGPGPFRRCCRCGVTRLSSLFEVPAQLAMLLSLAASTAATDPTAAVAEVAAPAADIITISQPLEGPLRFSDHTWMRALHENGKEADAHGARVFVTSGGRYYVPPPSDRSRVLVMRNDAEFAARIAWATATRNAGRMHAALHRVPMAGDLYIAHVFGAEMAISLLDTAARDPDAAFDKRFPELAGASAAQRGNQRTDHGRSVLSAHVRCAARAAAPHRHWLASDAGRRAAAGSRRRARGGQDHRGLAGDGRGRQDGPPHSICALSSGTARPARAHRGCDRGRTS